MRIIIYKHAIYDSAWSPIQQLTVGPTQFNVVSSIYTVT